MELPPLKLERARFFAPVETDKAQVAADGWDRIEFVVQTNPGSRPGPLMKVASGGELSRFLLALKVSLAERGTWRQRWCSTKSTRASVARSRRDRSAPVPAREENAQVLAVTHAPQIAARSKTHFKIIKGEAGADRVATRVITLAAADRREEIARMLAGAEITREARAAAKSLIEKAG